MANFSDGLFEQEWNGHGIYYLTDSQVLFAWAMTIICLIGVLTNSIVLYKLKRTIKSMDARPHYRFLMNLFIADFLMCLTNGPMFMSTAIHRVIDSASVLCSCQSVFALAFATASILLLVCLSYDRFVLVIRQEIMSKKLSYVILSIVWFLAALIGTMILIPVGGFSYSVSTSGAFCSSTWWGRQWGILHPLFSSFILFTALLVVIYHYSSIFLHVKKAHNNIGTISRTHFHRDKRRQLVTSNMQLLVLVFVANWSLYLIVILYQMIRGESFGTRLAMIDILGTFFGFFNSTVNPVVYAFLNRKKFKADSRRLLELQEKKLQTNEKIRQKMRATLPIQPNRTILRQIQFPTSQLSQVISSINEQKKVSVGRDKFIFIEPKKGSQSSREYFRAQQHRRRHSLPNILVTDSTSTKKRRQGFESKRNLFQFPAVLPKTPPFATLIEIKSDKPVPESKSESESKSKSNESSKKSRGERTDRHRAIKVGPCIAKSLQPPALKLTQSLNI